ncbi:amidohydrolase family protein [Myxococcota bacterium]|nr:amidohydrolase family protein [Myxococcota bacterium]
MHEIAIRGGTVVDGTGAKAARLDVGISGGRIAELAPSVRGTREIDASGRLVVPGFIDIHTHYDPQVLWDRALTPSSWQGVTSVVAGNCGYSIAPTKAAERGSLMRTLDKVEDMRLETLEAGVRWDFESYPQYLDAVERAGVAINFGGYVGHTPVRAYVLGDDAYERKATDAEVAKMKQVVADSIRGGALGFSSDRAGFHIGDGGRPVPSVMSSQEELEALASVPGEIGLGVVHLAAGEEFAWIYDFQKKMGRRLNWSAILTYPASWTSRAPYQEKLARHVAERKAGADVWAQVTCRPIVQQIVMREPTSFYQMPAFAELAALPHADRPKLFADRVWRARVTEQFDSRKWIDPGWKTVTISESAAHSELVGRSVQSLADERGVTPFDVVSDVSLDDGLLTRFEIVFANDDVEGVGRLLSSDGCILGLSDAGAHVGQICDAVMPTDFLANWVRDRGLMSIEKGIHKLTGEIGHVLAIDRGILAIGRPADVVVLDWERVAPGPIRRVVDMPAGGDRLIADRPGGIDHVLVNGVPIRSEGRSVLDSLGRWPGRVLRATA